MSTGQKKAKGIILMERYVLGDTFEIGGINSISHSRHLTQGSFFLLLPNWTAEFCRNVEANR